MEHPPNPIPTFTPVPRARERSNGWKPEVQQAFIEALADTGSVRAACRRVGRTEHGAYQLRRHPEADSFRAAWDAALAHGIARIEDVAMDRALNGVEVPVYSYGKLVGTRTVYNDRLLMFILRNRAPERFAADSGHRNGAGAVGKAEKRRLKGKWRKRWEAELAAQRAAEDAARPSPVEVRAGIARKVDALREQVIADKRAEWRLLSPAARAAFVHWQELRARDLGKPWQRPSWALGEDALAAELAARSEADKARDAAAEAEFLRSEDWNAEKQQQWIKDGTGLRELPAPRVRTLKDESWR